MDMTPDLDMMNDSKGNGYFMTDVADLPKEFFSKYVKGKKFVDIGAGDGRIVLHAHRCGANAFGIELDDEMIKRCILKRKIKKADFLEMTFERYEVLFFCIGNSPKSRSDFIFANNLINFEGILIVYHRKVPHRVQDFEKVLKEKGFKFVEAIKYVSVYKK